MAQLRKSNTDSSALLRAISSIADPHVCKAVLQGVIDGSIPRSRVLEEFSSGLESSSSASPSQGSPLPTVSCSTSTSCFEQLLSWRSCRPNITDDDVQAEANETSSVRSTILSLPALPLDAYTTQSQEDTWTQTGWTKAHVRHLIDALRTWDHLPFCLFSEDRFLRDYSSGSTQFCSSALVHAILALSTRLINESSDDAGLDQSGWLRSQFFLHKAKAILQYMEPSRTLPDIQALGMLSLYYLRCGQETEAQAYAESFATSISELCQHSLMHGEEEVPVQSCNTYHGAVSLIRMLSLATGRLFNAPITTAQENLFSSDQLSSTAEKMEMTGGSLKPNIQTSRHWNTQFLAANLFRLTEWVYQTIVSAQSNPQAACSGIGTWYLKCLDCMYYHFCLLCAFRPFVGLVMENTNIQPHKICTQAAKSILSLAQSYDDLFTLRRVSGLMPYFITASSLFSLSMEDAGSRVVDMHPRSSDNTCFLNEVEMKDDELDATGDGVPVPQCHVKVSVVAHSRLLLSKMSTTHPAAAAAGRILEREIERRPGF
ncbi:Conidial development protein fluffy [Madurella mycetomatis]|uniref:Conidial development protein fluffy n=1 Tax=Madurella mycetomatis TaxID=100816 RepID=A0A175W3S7_9PEZI|nr:Conidial development protein fluffy [Madurella mycetomatis]